MKHIVTRQCIGHECVEIRAARFPATTVLILVVVPLFSRLASPRLIEFIGLCIGGHLNISG